MTWLLREVFLLAIAGVVSWWLFLGWSFEPFWKRPLVVPAALPIAVTPNVKEPDVKEPSAPQPAKPDNRPPPSERGTPDGSEEGSAPAEARPASAPEPENNQQDAVQDAMRDTELLAVAQEEVSGETRKGFATVFLAAAEDQLDIARFFGEELVLVPRSAMNPQNSEARYFRLAADGQSGLQQVQGRPPLRSYRQYRDLFDYEYARLPAPVRQLRRSVLVRSEVYLFAALIPVSEWAVVVARRRAALAAAGRKLEDARRFTLRYRRLGGNTFDVEVAEILFRDGRRFRPPASRGDLPR